MSDKKTVILRAYPHQSREYAKQLINDAPDGYHVTIRPPTRSPEQNAMLHSICSSLSKQKEFAGAKRTTVQWKVLLVSGHAIATNRGSEMVPGIEGEFVNLRESTAEMPVKRLSSLIEYCLAYCVENDITLIDDGGAFELKNY